MDPALLREELCKGRHLEEAAIVSICDKLIEILTSESNVLYLQSPITVVGDIHGQIFDLFKMFELSGQISDGNKYLFLGDYVDRGFSSIETFAYLALLKIKYPTSIYLLRGNHESRQVNQMYGLFNDCLQVYGHAAIWFLYNEVFDTLPISAIIDKKIYCVHGGLSPDIKMVGRIFTDIQRKQEIPQCGPFADLCWSDPDDVKKFIPNKRGAGYIFGPNEVEQFLHLNRLNFIARSHQLSMAGYTWLFDQKIVTVWSAPNYMYRSGNKASVMKVSENDATEFLVYTEDSRSDKKIEDLKSVTVPVAVLYITIFFGGIILLISFGIICSTKITILMQTLASYCFSVVFTFLVVVLIQNMIGRPRPDTKSYCGGNGSFKDCTESLNTKQLTEQYRSFPSLPSAIAMAVGVFLTYFLIEIWSTYSLFQTFISLVPVCLALFVGACEIWDRNCHIEDVITGFVIGSLISFVTVKFFTQQVNERNEMKREESTSSSFRILFTN
ncbi:Ser/Thr protein phosphatase [Histomonas meleagridis]|uniref:Ser/Thr protein phosphatase n=1 Tax=Histomonas meleagridis TaxID=135588 RepID=UPI003559456E|nr:Ser/Thr protein phosphatase [Histomonas meleagridis]KAH0803199.1 Ser/Thr protein phosphatase [Histomonas meleagridis]